MIFITSEGEVFWVRSLAPPFDLSLNKTLKTCSWCLSPSMYECVWAAWRLSQQPPSTECECESEWVNGGFEWGRLRVNSMNYDALLHVSGLTFKLSYRFSVHLLQRSPPPTSFVGKSQSRCCTCLCLCICVWISGQGEAKKRRKVKYRKTSWSYI